MSVIDGRCAMIAIERNKGWPKGGLGGGDEETRSVGLL